jgi:hypothetical protein
MEAHGVSIVEISRAADGAWSYNQSSQLNRRITPLTVMTLNGPARGNPQMSTLFSPNGTQGRGTINNCANGYTAWGTNLTCEENWAGYFRRPAAADNPRRSAREVAALARYGVTSSTGNYGWASVRPADQSSTIYRRWDAQVDPNASNAAGDFRNEPNQFGWVVEIDPYDPSKTPRKRTASGEWAMKERGRATSRPAAARPFTWATIPAANISTSSCPTRPGPLPMRRPRTGWRSATNISTPARSSTSHVQCRRGPARGCRSSSGRGR